MPKKKIELSEVINSLMTLGEAQDWIEQHQEEFNLLKPISTDTLKKACLEGRLQAVLKGKLYLTRERELRDYLKRFDPKNKTERQPIKERAKRRREVKADQTASISSSGGK